MNDASRAAVAICRRPQGTAGAVRRLSFAGRAFAGLLLLAAMAMPALPAFAAERSAMVIDANSGTVLYSAAADTPRYPASLTKMMTLYMTFDLIEKGRLGYGDTIPISAQASAQPPSKLDLDPGDRISVRDAVRALVTKSANDIAVALAEHIGGSEANFARLMTKRARDIGMTKTTFKNASGLPNDEQVTTARDMLTLALRLQDDFPEHYKVFATRAFSYKGASHRNHNTLLYHYRGTDGIKTGYTRASGFNLVTSVHRDGRHLVAAVFGGSTAGSRNAEMRAILDRSFARASTRRTRARSPQLIAKPAPARRPPAEVAQALAPAPKPAPRIVAAAAGLAPAPRPVTPAAPPVQAAEPVRIAEPNIASRVSVARVRNVRLAAAGDGTIARQSDGAILPALSAGAPPGLQDDAGTAAPGRPPSTLHEQLANILAANRSDPAEAAAVVAAPAQRVAAVPDPTFRLRGPVDEPASRPTATATRTGDYVIQIGAFDSESEAQRRLEAARGLARDVLAGAAPLTEPVAVGTRKLVRARFAGFDSSGATRACTQLRRHSVDCMVARAR